MFNIQVSNPLVVIYCSNLYTKDIKKKKRRVHAQIQNYFPVELGPRDFSFSGWSGGGGGGYVRCLFCKKKKKEDG